MDGFELLAVVVFFLIGYWVADYFWPRKKSTDNPPDRDPPSPEQRT